MRLNKRELSEKLDVSEATLTTWQREGMPVLEHGSRGKPGVYDLAAVVRWMRATGFGSRAKNPNHVVNLDALVRELAGEVAKPASQFPDSETIHAIEEATGASLIPAAAWMVQLFKLDPIVAVHCVEIAAHE